MYRTKKSFIIFNILIFVFIFVTIAGFIVTIQAQYWTPLPPYNVLWPLWSPVLSPVDPITGLATPLVTSLTRNTILPTQPGLAWDPCQPGVEAFPWLLYNTPLAFGGGLTYWDVYYGMNPWPPEYMLDPVTGAPITIALPLGWTLLLPTSLSHFGWFVPLSNAIFSYRYGVPIADLLTTADIWGFTPLAALPPPII
ncbi:MAG: hypothetical protein ACMUIU_16530 [bacterium]